MNPRQWLLKVIRMRRMIIRLHRSHKGTQECDFLQRHLQAYNYSDRTLAAFFIRHSDKIYGILPGKGSKAQKKFENEFASILEQCNEIVSSSKYQVAR